jgi:hypothetical protein
MLSFIFNTKKQRLIRALQNIYHLRRTGITSRMTNIKQQQKKTVEFRP